MGAYVSALTYNNMLSSLAVNYVRTNVTYGASNKVLDLIRTFGYSYECVAEIRSHHSATRHFPNIPAWLVERAYEAQTYGCGNCGEQAALAFMYLHVNHGAKPLDYMSMTTADHAFVVIGRAARSLEYDYRTWGEAAVICDPWDRKYFPAIEIPDRLYSGKNFGAKSLCRI